MICKNCGSQKFKKRKDLTENELFLIERLSSNQTLSDEEMKDDLFCKRCLYQLVIDRHEMRGKRA